MRTLVLLLGLLLECSAASVWIEGEDATAERSMRPQHQWYDQVNAGALSGGKWLSHFSFEQEGRVGYPLSIAQDGSYRLWLRANYHAARLSFRIDDGEWQKVDFAGQPLRGKTVVSGDRQLDIRFLGWAAAGEHQLRAGDHRLELRFHSENHNHGAIDCLVFTTLDWKPFGTDRPPQ